MIILILIRISIPLQKYTGKINEPIQTSRWNPRSCQRPCSGRCIAGIWLLGMGCRWRDSCFENCQIYHTFVGNQVMWRCIRPRVVVRKQHDPFSIRVFKKKRELSPTKGMAAGRIENPMTCCGLSMFCSIFSSPNHEPASKSWWREAENISQRPLKRYVWQAVAELGRWQRGYQVVHLHKGDSDIRGFLNSRHHYLQSRQWSFTTFSNAENVCILFAGEALLKLLRSNRPWLFLAHLFAGKFRFKWWKTLLVTYHIPVRYSIYGGHADVLFLQIGVSFTLERSPRQKKQQILYVIYCNIVYGSFHVLNMRCSMSYFPYVTWLCQYGNDLQAMMPRSCGHLR